MTAPSIVPRGVLTAPKGTSMLVRFNAEHAAEVLRVRRMWDEAKETDANEAAPVTLGTRTWT